MKRILDSALMAALLVGLVNGQQVIAQSGSSERPSFEVASVKPVEQCGQSFSPQPGARIMIASAPKIQPGGRYTACGSLKSIIVDAYKADFMQVSGGPDWIEKAQFQIEAKAEESAGKDQVALMVQSLLEERFKLKFHRESRETGVYSLVVAKGGPKLKEAKDENGNPMVSLPPPPDRAPSPEEIAKLIKSGAPRKTPPGGFSMMLTQNGAELHASAVTIQKFADSLRNTVGRKVVDRTGLTGLYDVELHYAQDTQLGQDRIMVPGSNTPVPVANSGPSIYTAIQEQLGLKLEPEKVPLEYLVVDSAEKPSEN